MIWDEQYDVNVYGSAESKNYVKNGSHETIARRFQCSSQVGRYFQTRFREQEFT
jgi:hypothetical protein